MTYLVWYDVWLKGEEKRTDTPSRPTVWHSFDTEKEVRQHIVRLANRAFLDGRTISITISPKE